MVTTIMLPTECLNTGKFHGSTQL